MRVRFIHHRNILVGGIFFCKRLFIKDLVDEVLLGHFIKAFDAKALSYFFEFGYQLVVQLYNVVHGR